MITFTDPRAVDFLLKHRYVYTIRKTKRPTGRQVTIIKGERGTSWRTYSKVTRVILVTNNTLDQFYKESGFDSWTSWRDAAEKLHNVTLGAGVLVPEDGDYSIFKVELIEKEGFP